jgi:hypothetical protein
MISSRPWIHPHRRFDIPRHARCWRHHLLVRLHWVGLILPSLLSTVSVNRGCSFIPLIFPVRSSLQLLTVIVLADITTLRWRGLAQGISTMPFVINTFIGAEVAEGVINGEEGRWRQVQLLLPLDQPELGTDPFSLLLLLALLGSVTESSPFSSLPPSLPSWPLFSGPRTKPRRSLTKPQANQMKVPSPFLLG